MAVDLEEYRKSKEYAYWWVKYPKRVHVFKRIMAGQSFRKIKKDLKLVDRTFNEWLAHPAFQARLEQDLKARSNFLRLKKLIDLPEIYDDLKQEFKARLSEASTDRVIQEYIKLLNAKQQGKDIKNMVNVFMDMLPNQKKNVLKKKLSEGKTEDLKEDFGFEGELQINEEEAEQSTDPEVDSGQGSENEQGKSD